MKIGQLAAKTKTAVETIRYYERVGILSKPPRNEAGYRLYGRGDAEELAFIRRCRGLDMSLAEIKTLLAFRNDPARECGEVNDLVEKHTHLVAQRIGELQALQRQLKALSRQCGERRQSAACGILNSLNAQSHL